MSSSSSSALPSIAVAVAADISSFRTSVYKTKEPVVQTCINSLLFLTLLLGHSGGNSWGIQVGIHGAFNGHSGVIIGHSGFWATQGHGFSHSTAVSIRVEVPRESTVPLSAGRRRRMPFPPLGARQSSKILQHIASHCARSICSALRPTVLVPAYYSPTPCTLLSCLRFNSKILRMLRPYCRRRRHRHQQRCRHSCCRSHPRCPCRRCPCRRRSRRCRRHSKLSLSLMPS